MTRLRGRAPCGDRLVADAPFGHWGTQTFIAGLRCNELIAPWVLDGPMNRAAFDTYIETQLAPCLDPGDVVILDNLSAHKSATAQTCLKAQDNWMLFLPPYSPDLNPIEMAFSKLKAHLRRIKARTLDQLWRAVGDICELFDQKDCWKFFKAAPRVSRRSLGSRVQAALSWAFRIEGVLRFVGGDVSDGAVQALCVVPCDPFQGFPLDLSHGFPGALMTSALTGR